MEGLQAQAPLPPYLGLWTRLRRFQIEDLSALLTSRAAVRTALMRATPLALLGLALFGWAHVP